MNNNMPTKSIQVACLANEVAVGGGYSWNYATNEGNFANKNLITYNRPATVSGNPGWEARAYQGNASYVWSLTVYVLCAAVS